MAEQSEQGMPTDIIILIIGQTGVGKSTLVNQLCGTTRLKVGDDLNSITTTIQSADVQIPHGLLKDRRLVLAETPGFNGVHDITDSDIFKQAANWLITSYDPGMKIAGIIYLHDINDARLPNSGRENLGALRGFCGDDKLDVVLLATTKWDSLKDPQMGQARERGIRQKYWRNAIRRLDGTPDSAWAIVDDILLKNIEATNSQLLKDFGGGLKNVLKTEALNGIKILRKQEERVGRVKADEKVTAEVQEEYIREQALLCRILQPAVDNPKVQLSRRVLVFFGVTYTFDSGKGDLGSQLKNWFSKFLSLV